MPIRKHREIFVKMIMRNLIKEPLIQFLLFGLILTGLYAWYGSTTQSRNQLAEIKLENSDLERLSAQWQQQMGRAPASNELAGIVQQYIKQRIYYLEAKRLGLHVDDIIIQRRLAQKLEFLAQNYHTDQAESVPLEIWFNSSKDCYKIPESVSYKHIYFSVDSRGEVSVNDAIDVLNKLRSSTSDVRGDKFGDQFPFEKTFLNSTRLEVINLMGEDFADAVFNMAVGEWGGPIRSAYGWHLVYIDEYKQEQVPTLQAVHEEVLSDWKLAKAHEAATQFYIDLYDKYSVQVSAEAKAKLPETFSLIGESYPLSKCFLPE